MTGIEDIFLELGLSQYLDSFVEQGFDTWDTILDITESDFDVLGVKLGHRRKIQRRIANSRGLSSDQALVSPTRNTLIDDRQSGDQNSSLSKLDSKDGGHSNGKRKYRRHPKPDENAPERPPSAYVIFSNKMRVDLKGRNLSFTEIAKLVGENWQNLSLGEKEPYEAEAFRAKEKYNNELARYKRTEEYKKYAEYLVDFKEKQANLHNAATDSSKRPRLEHQASTGSSVAGSSADSQHGADGAATSGRGDGGGGSTGSPAASRFFFGKGPSPSSKSFPIPNVTGHQNSTVKFVDQYSPAPTNSLVLPGYRDCLVGAQQQKVAWRDGRRASDASSPPKVSRTSNGNERRSHPPAGANADHSSQFGLHSQNGYRPGSGFSPPALLTSESTASTSISSASNSSLHTMPRTPLEPPFERQLSMAPLYASKSQGSQLPPIRSMSISPQSSINVSYDSPSSEPNFYPQAVHLRCGAGSQDGVVFPRLTSAIDILAMDNNPAHGPRGYVPASQTHIELAAVANNAGRILPHHSTHEILDPVSALLKADEMVNRAGRKHQPI